VSKGAYAGLTPSNTRATGVSPGKWIRGGYRLEFSQDGQTYANEVVAQITICTPDAVDAAGECSMKVPDDKVAVPVSCERGLPASGRLDELSEQYG
jgi:hypothetical protein